MRTTLTMLTLAAITGLVGCKGESQPQQAAAPTKASTWLLQNEPSNAATVAEIKAGAEAGEEITMVGRIGGRMEPISTESPVFIMVDLEVPHCGQIPGDACKTPWDYCCEPQDNLTANSATIQLVGADGATLDVNLADAGLSPLDEVVVVGVVGPRPNADVLTIRASGVYRKQ